MTLDGVGDHVLARLLLILGDEAPPALTQVPVHDREGNEILQALELPRDQSPMRLVLIVSSVSERWDNGVVGITYPRACIADVDVIATLFGREFGTALARDPVTERADLALELARLVAGLDPIGNLVCSRLGIAGSSVSRGYRIP